MRHHLAIIYRPLVRLILDGRKTIECRLGSAGVPPHGSLEAGDLIWFKEVGGPVRLVAIARSVRCFQSLSPHEVNLIRTRFDEQIQAPRSFWQAHRHAQAATLAWLGEICELEPFQIAKRDRRGWVVLDGPPVPCPKAAGRGHPPTRMTRPLDETKGG